MASYKSVKNHFALPAKEFMLTSKAHVLINLFKSVSILPTLQVAVGVLYMY